MEDGGSILVMLGEGLFQPPTRSRFTAIGTLSSNTTAVGSEGYASPPLLALMPTRHRRLFTVFALAIVGTDAHTSPRLLALMPTRHRDCWH
jgi:hypothetical protein